MEPLNFKTWFTGDLRPMHWCTAILFRCFTFNSTADGYARGELWETQGILLTWSFDLLPTWWAMVSTRTWILTEFLNDTHIYIYIIILNVYIIINVYIYICIYIYVYIYMYIYICIYIYVYIYNTYIYIYNIHIYIYIQSVNTYIHTCHIIYFYRVITIHNYSDEHDFSRMGWI